MKEISALLQKLALRAQGPVIAVAIAAIINAISPELFWLGAFIGVGAGAFWIGRLREHDLERLMALREKRRAVRSMREIAPEPDALTTAEPVLNDLPVALALVNSRGQVEFANAAMRLEIGRNPVGELFASIFRAPPLLAALQAAHSSGEPLEADFTIHRSGERHLRALIRPIVSPSSGVAIILLDQTRSRRAEKLHRDFVANASHELKTPLAAISGFTETLLGPARDDEAARDRFLTLMSQQTQRMSQLVQDLLSLNRIELNEHVAPLERVDLKRIVNEATNIAAFSDIEVEMETDSETGDCVVVADHREITQVATNLVENALKHGRGSRPPRVSIIRDPARPGMIGLCVEDFGPGIPKEHLPRLTERFYRVGHSDPRGSHAPGTGLGLAIVKHVMSRHRGELQIESKLGHGSQFVAWIPASS